MQTTTRLVQAPAELMRALAAPFPEADLEWRVQQAGDRNGRVWARVLPYLSARAVMARLDAVLGLEDWQVDYAPGPAGGVMARLSIRVQRAHGTSEWVVKCDGAPTTDVESIKGGYSAALKRAAVLVGVGRYLYGLGEQWARVHSGGGYHGRTKSGAAFRWDPPGLPTWALPGGETARHQQTAPAADDALVRATEATPAEAGRASFANLVELDREVERLSIVDHARGVQWAAWLREREGRLDASAANEALRRMRRARARAERQLGITAMTRAERAERAAEEAHLSTLEGAA